MEEPLCLAGHRATARHAPGDREALPVRGLWAGIAGGAAAADAHLPTPLSRAALERRAARSRFSCPA